MFRHTCRSLTLAVVMSVLLCPVVFAGTLDGDTTAVPVKEQTSTTYSVSQSDIQQLPTRGYESVVILQPGVVIDRRYGAVHIRGGEATDADYYIDGISQRDGFTGNPMAPVSNNMLEKITLEPGPFDGAHGNVTSGIIGVKTIDGGSELHGTLEAATDNFHGENYDYNIYSVALNGPLIPNSDKLTFSAAGERLWFGDGRWNWQGKLRWKPTDKVTARFSTLGSDAEWQTIPRAYYFDYEHAPRTSLKNNSVWGEITHTPNEHVWYSLRGSWLKRERKTGDGVYFDNLWGYGRPGDYSPSPESTDLFWSWDNLHIDSEGNQIITPTYDSVLTVPMFEDRNYNGVVDQGEPVYLDGKPIEQSFVYNFTRVDSVANETEYTTTFADEGHVYDDFEEYQSSSVNGRFDLTADIAPRHQVQAGAEFRRHTLRYYRHYFPIRIYLGANGGFDDINSYGYDILGRETDADQGLNGAKHPVDMGGYLQDRAQFGDLTVNAGVRIDRFDYDVMALRDPENPLDPDGFSRLDNPTDSQLVEANRLTASDLKEVETYTRVSPRIGLAFPVAPQTSVHMSAGQFYRRPDLQDLYVNYDFLEFKVKTGGYYALFGNAALKPAKTTNYEIGVHHRVSDRASVSLTGYYKDIENLLAVVNQPATPTNFITLLGDQSATVKGIEVDAHLRCMRGLSTQLKYTFEDASGGDLFRDTGRNVAWTVGNAPVATGPLLHEQEHKFTAIVDVRAGKGEGPRLGSMYPLERAGINVVFMAASGFPYTPSRVFNEVTLGNASPFASDEFNSARAPSTYRVDLKANKMIPIGRATFDLYFWILNVLDRENAIDVYMSTGQPDNTGWLDTAPGEAFIANNSTVTDVSGLTGEQKYRLREDDPHNFGAPRQIRFGARLLF